MRAMYLIIVWLFVFLFSGIIEENAYAYLDPGTGSYIFQLIIGAIIGGLFAIKLFWIRIFTFFKNIFSKKRKNE